MVIGPKRHVVSAVPKITKLQHFSKMDVSKFAFKFDEAVTSDVHLDGAIMEIQSEHLLLSEDEAAELLRPHVSNKAVAEWLARDRERDPVLPYIVVGGCPFYREAEVVGFIKRLLNPDARFVRVQDRLVNERRTVADRRQRPDRRRNQALHLQWGFERRRWRELDRRLRGDLSRRSQLTG